MILYQTKDGKEGGGGEQSQEIYECYYCNNFQPTTNQREYEKHVFLYIQIN